jgi:hypothetical protein
MQYKIIPIHNFIFKRILDRLLRTRDVVIGSKCFMQESFQVMRHKLSNMGVGANLGCHPIATILLLQIAFLHL